jgi:S-(hydroxymethyl)glutathione dehydrogenase / alcohol dehydrogenase
MQIAHTRAAILAQSRRPLIVDDIGLPTELDVGQVLVEVLYSTICGAQLNEIAAAKGPDKFLPHLLGHEASARVLEVGPGVAHVVPGNTVVMHWRPSLGIQSRTPSYAWGERKLNAGWVTTFNEHAIASENRLTVIPDDYDPKLAPLLGCAVTTAFGVVNNDADVNIGDAVVVCGVGGVGLNIVQFAALAGAYPLVAVDLFDAKLDMARALGATHAINASEGTEIGAEIRSIVGDRGADKVIETTGAKAVIEMAYDVTHPDGRCVLVGVPDSKVSISTLPLHFNKVLTGSHGGGARPHIDISRIIRLQRAGRIALGGIITHEYSLAEINTALDTMRGGAAGRVLIRLRGP